VGADGFFEVGGLLPGHYTLSGRLGLQPDTLFEVEGIEVAVGETTEDPRLAAIELSGPLHLYVVKIVSPDGTRLREGTAQIPGAARTDKIYGERNGVMRFASLDPAIEVDVGAYGRRTVRVVLHPPEETVVLHAAISVLLVLPDAATLPLDRIQLSIGLHDPSASEDAPRSHKGMNEHGEVRLRLPTAGFREVGFMIADRREVGSPTNHREVRVENPEVFQVLDTDVEQRFVLELPAEVVEAARAR